MSDPAIDAAERTRLQLGHTVFGDLVTAAREALAPVRELHKPGEVVHGHTWCSCATGDPYLDNLWKDCPTAQACYTTEELEQ